MEKLFDKAIFAAGCFWHVQAAFDKVPGVISTVVGYAGGIGVPDYKTAAAKGYAEAIEIVFNPGVISYPELLEIFWQNHDPTTLNRQGADQGRQYRSAVFYQNEKQRIQALNSMKKIQKTLADPIVTEMVAAKNFYPAEEYHQKYFAKNTGLFCR